MTVPRAHLKQMRADQEYERRKAELERMGEPGLLRFLEIERRYSDPDDPTRLLGAQMQETVRQYASAAGVCDDCLAKLHDPLA